MRLEQRTLLQTVWGWKVAAYLFGAGMGAGAYAAGAATLLLPDLGSRSAGLFAMILGAVVVILSVPFLILDLERPLGFFRVLWRAKSSWLSRGAYILMAFSGLAVLNVLLGAPQWLTGLSLAAAVAVATYTGLLIGTMLARPIWNTPILPVLFLVSALSTGLAAIGLVGMLSGQQEVHALAAALRIPHMLLLIGELLVLYFYLTIVNSRTPDAVSLLLRGALSRTFWWGVVLVGLVLPIVLDLLAPAAGAALEAVSAVCVLVGGYLLRRAVLAAGTRAKVYLGASFVIRPEV